MSRFERSQGVMILGGDPAAADADRMSAELKALRAEHQGFEFALVRVHNGMGFEAVRTGGDGNPLVLVSSDAAELREALADAALG